MCDKLNHAGRKDNFLLEMIENASALNRIAKLAKIQRRPALD